MLHRTYLNSRVSRLPLAVCLSLVALAANAASEQPAPTGLLITNARVFDGKSARPVDGVSVLVEGNKIVRVARDSLAAPAGATVIDAGGRTLMPGLIDAHWHATSAVINLADAMAAPQEYTAIVAAKAAGDTLMRGFTSVRDMAGNTFGLKRAIDEGLIPGPRIWPSGAMISQTSGHGDYRSVHDLPRTAQSPLSRAEVVGGALIADGPDEVRRAVREELMKGATQIKLAAGGGVASNFDPLDVTQYGDSEFRAAVEAAENWGTYIAVHAYTPRAIRTAILAGVRCIEHGQLLDEATAQLMAEKGVWLSMQPFLDDADAIPFPEGSANRAKQLQMTEGTDRAYALAKKFKLRTAWGTDTLFDAKLAARQGAQLAKMVRWYTPSEVLLMATGNNAELLAMSGPRNPYPGAVGVIQEGALADLLLVDGDPVANIKLLEHPARNLLLIVKDGRVHKDIVPR